MNFGRSASLEDFTPEVEQGLADGHDGGTVVFEGPPAALLENKESLTGKYLKERLG